ncbi:uncharacterized protein LOC133468616 isoform X2 [Phyllopteryx taeniolatus]|nr:uncharacterized protein LOC133468616 isoform X2 [Phyllopteryx taeniolatus]
MATSSTPGLPQDDDGLWEFLRNRGVHEESIQKIKQDHIDSSIIGEIDDAALASYIPAYGDRIATRRFSVEKQRRGGDDTKRLSLFQKLSKKMGTMGNKVCDHGFEGERENTVKPTNVYLKNNKRAWKTTRKIELGWIHNNKQVRKRSGGGTRVLDINKNATKTEILSQAKQLFFPNEKSTMGKWEEFSHDIVNFQEAQVDEDVSVRECYDTHKLALLRFYLFTKTLAGGDDQEEGADIPTDEQHENSTECGQKKQTMEKVEQLTWKRHSSEISQIHTTEDDELSTAAVQIIDLTSLCNTSEVSFGPLTGGPFLGDLDDTLLHDPNLAIEDEQLNILTYTSTPNDAETAFGRPPSPSFELLHVTVKLHRVTLLDELITQFKDEAVMTNSVKYSFIDEMGADADGVSRDVYAAFWTEFLDCAAEGADVRVPSLSPKWQEEEWKSVGRILAKGLNDHGYFPFRLAQAFTAAIIFGEHSVSSDLLFDSLMLYLSQSERHLLSTALQEAVIGDDEEEFLDLMDRMGVRTVPTQDNLRAVLIQVAHKQIIQHPKYALDNIAEVAGPTLRKFFPNVEDMKKLYEDIKPTTQKVIKMITAFPATSAENQSLRFLHQYIRGLDEISLRKLMRFLTGSDVICVKEIQITFTSLEGLARRPIAHTCGPTVELPSTYSSYPELRAEMEAILSSNTHAMDIA